ncbi:MAG: hypothetical protein EP330_10285 [Deltaproteobacteria bacterium]|nr:MAG: hypothetical protein EP330_10285 [Deltaproteobacteria bacterium]
MTTWEERIAAANDDAERRRLLAELGGWRARNLGDVMALREAARAMSSLYALLGDNAAAVREAESLVSLCQTHPVASPAELRKARALAQSLGGGGVVGPRARGERRERGERGERKERKKPQTRSEGPTSDGLGPAREALASGDLDGARKALRRKKGADAALLRAAVWVEEIRGGAPEERDASLERLATWIRRQVGASAPAERTEAPKAEKKPAKPKAEVMVDDSALAAFLGEAVPSRRRARIHALERAAAARPDQVGELASLALQHHVDTEGAESPAPWLVGIVAQAVVSGQGDAPLATIASLREQGAVAVAAYGEWAWTAAIDAVSAIEGAEFEGLRRGVLARGGEPEERKVWTLRLQGPQGKALIAFANPDDATYPEDFAGPVAERVKSLADGALLVAPGTGNASLRDAAANVGLAVSDATEASAWAAAVVWAGKSERKPAEPKPERKSVDEANARLLAVLGADSVDADALSEALSAYDRLHKAFVAVRGAELSDAAQLAFLQGVHAAAPAKARLPEGTSSAVRLASAGVDGAVALLTEGETAERFGGAGIDTVLEAARALHAAGVRLDRAVRGAMARERRQDPVLSALDAGADGVWRLMGTAGETQVQLAVLAVDTPEARAALPRLWSRSQALLLPEDAMAWYAELDGPKAFTDLGEAVSATTGA